jgi:hypothetical protein
MYVLGATGILSLAVTVQLTWLSVPVIMGGLKLLFLDDKSCILLLTD